VNVFGGDHTAANECSRTLTPATWSVFRQAFPDQVDREQTFYFAETTHRRPDELHYLARFSTKLDSSCLTFLCIRGLHLGFRDLLTLTDIHTLSGLAIGRERAYPGAELTDLHMRNWGRAVREKHAFKNLRLLVLCEIGPSTSDILRGISSFPALHLACLSTSGHNERRELKVNGMQGHWQPVDATPEAGELHTIWSEDQRIHISVLVKLFDMSRRMSQLPSRAEAGDASLCLSYRGEPLSRYKQHGQDIRYYVRLPDRAVPVEMDDLEKSQSSQHDNQSRPTKKRKVREGKQKDIGSLLGSFF
jgi:hypothetical protein